MGSHASAVHRGPWNRGKIADQEGPIKLKDIRALIATLMPPSTTTRKSAACASIVGDARTVSPEGLGASCARARF